MMPTDTLFEQHTIKEIQETEKKLRDDIEKKKEELRQMVGERYRDLMDAADTITEMNQMADGVAFHINAMENHCNKLQLGSLKTGIINTVKLKVVERKKKNENLYSISALIKVLMDVPAKVWQYIEVGDNLRASLLFLLARHTHSVLMMDPIYIKQGLLFNFPIINKQWSSTCHLQHVLLQKSRDMLLNRNASAEDFVGPLCCILFLSDTSVEQIFSEFLSTQKVVALNVFKPEKSAKNQICELVGVIQDTFKIVHALFYPNPCSSEDVKTNLLHDTVKHIVSKESQGPISLLDSNSPTFQYLPKDVVAYRPMPKMPMESITVDLLQNTCKDWINSLNSEVIKQIEELLRYVATIKGLALIRESVMEQLYEESQWDDLCNHLLGEPFSVWDYFLRGNFMERIKDIIRSQVELCVTSCLESVEKIMSQSQNDDSGENVSSYIWAESESDLASNLGWVPHHQRHLWDSGTLGMKAYGLTPKVQSISSVLDKHLYSLVEDVSCFSPTEKNRELDFYRKAVLSVNPLYKSSDPFADFKAICEYLTEVSDKSFYNLIDLFEEYLGAFETEKSEIKTLSGLVFLGHLCHGIAKLCPHLVQCLMKENVAKSSKQLSMGFLSGSKDDQLWQGLKLKLLELSDSAFRTWMKFTINDIVSKFKSELAVCSETGILKLLLQWDKIEIQEESEEGEAVKSILRIPQQVSVSLHSALFTFCLKVSEIGGHAVNSVVRLEMQEQFLAMLMDVYKLKVDVNWPDENFPPHLAQTQSLQLFFDVQFLVGLTSSQDSTDNQVSSISREVLAKVASHIDPFDMDVFSSHLQDNLRKALQKSVLIFGLITSPEQVSHLSNMKFSLPTGHIEHNLMLTPTLTSRLPLLPFATHSTSTTAMLSDSMLQPSTSSTLQASLKISRSHSSSPNLSASENLSTVLKSSSFYDRVTAMSSSWFGGT